MEPPPTPAPLPASPCATCGGSDAEMDEGLGICHACLARAAKRVVEEELARAEASLPRIAGFRMRRPVGAGGMGAVYEAERTEDGLRVAVKLVAAEIAGEERFRAQFRREAEALGALDHPGIVRRLGTGEAEGRPWLAMEFVDGPDLRQVLRHGPLPVGRALEIASEVGAALIAAHACGVVHRDIKPANVLLDPEGRVKVADFGMARPHGGGEAAPDSLTLVPGAGHYSAPELERGGRGDARADVYSLGALLHHLLAGQAPRANYRPARRERRGAGISAKVDRIVFEESGAEGWRYGEER